jgi:long-subunit acyl-CoA synthetase (AMP-forming)
VVSLCSLEDDVTSTGKLLPHIQASIIDNELVVQSNCFLGYLNTPDSWNPSAIQTGDIATIKNNSLYLTGRIKNTIINSYGRNISPEWVESELMATGLFAQTVVLGDARPFCTALLVPVNERVNAAQIEKRLTDINQALPDYAQIFNPIVLAAPMRFEDGLYTQNMRPRRAAILDYFSDQIEQVYSLSTALEA